jgi:lipoprotein signal peptidase
MMVELAWFCLACLAAVFADRVVKLAMPSRRNPSALVARLPVPAAALALATALLLSLVVLPHGDPLLASGLGLALGGATGNFIDAATEGCVLDPLRLPGISALNIADIALVSGTLVAFCGMLL